MSIKESYLITYSALADLTGSVSHILDVKSKFNYLLYAIY